MTAALSQGGREYFGWGVDRHLNADLFDALNVNTKATGQWKKGKAPDFPLWPRPGRKSEGKGKRGTKANQPPKTTLADLYKQFMRR